jgi:hypothetical protein
MNEDYKDNEVRLHILHSKRNSLTFQVLLSDVL